MTGLIDRAAIHGTRTAFRTTSSSFTYAQLLQRSAATASVLLAGATDLAEERIAFQMPGGMPYAEVLWGIWRAGAIAVPLNATATAPEFEHVLRNTGVRRVIEGGMPQPALVEAAAATGAECLEYARLEFAGIGVPPRIEAQRRALIIFTSGTTSKPKGVVWTHGMLDAQITALVEAWEWQEGDSIPLFLPLHHVHGLLNVMCCALWSGACVEAYEHFDANTILARVLARAFSVFMAVPTVYVKLIQALEKLPLSERIQYRDAFGKLRLMVSGSAALPSSVHQQWRKLTGQVLLERYGMTEIGMALSNPLRGERRPGAVGTPLPAMEVRLVNEQGDRIDGEGEAGEVQVRGPGVFREYWNNPEATAAAFVDGWFRTGDMALREKGYYRILGRQSVDIIKSGGYKISALEIEQVLLSHPAIAECAVVGVPDATWGEMVAVAVVPREGKALDLAGLRQWCGDKLSDYKQPRRLQLLAALPRNAMGKVVKPELQQQLACLP